MLRGGRQKKMIFFFNVHFSKTVLHRSQLTKAKRTLESDQVILLVLFCEINEGDKTKEKQNSYSGRTSRS